MNGGVLAQIQALSTSHQTYATCDNEHNLGGGAQIGHTTQLRGWSYNCYLTQLRGWGSDFHLIKTAKPSS